MPKGIKGFQKGNKLGKAHLGKKRVFTEEWKKNMRIGYHKSFLLNGRKKAIRSDSWKKKHSDSIKGKPRLDMKGEGNPVWKGGISSPNYPEKVAGRPRPKLCEVCNGEGRICFDHDHKTGKFRGWICNHCNTTLGFARDRIEVLQKLIEYLKKSNCG